MIPTELNARSTAAEEAGMQKKIFVDFSQLSKTFSCSFSDNIGLKYSKLKRIFKNFSELLREGPPDQHPSPPEVFFSF